MEVERLLYTDDGSNPLNLGYGGIGEIKKLKSYKNIRYILESSADYTPNLERDLVINGRKTFRMGWSTAVIFKKEGTRLAIEKLYDVVSEKEKENMSHVKSMAFRQITTQGVDQCTLVCIVTQNRYFLAHFNYTELAHFKNILNSNMKDDPVQDVFFSGMIRSGDEEEKLPYNAWDTWRTENIGEASYITFRRSPNPGEATYFSHMEFGVGWDGNTMAYFGDIICRPPAILEKMNDKSCYCYPFQYSEINGLSGITEKAAILAEKELGGCC